MKKITLALCACAFALTGLLASCSNGSKDCIDAGKTYSNYKYAVTGTITTTTSSEYLKPSRWSSSLDADGKALKESSTSTSKVNGGWVSVSWTEDENRKSNYTNYSISGYATYTDGSVSNEWSYDTDKASNKGTSKGGSEHLNWTITDIDGTYYLSIDGEMVKLDDLAISEDEDTFEGDFGDEFSLNIKITKNNITDLEWNENDENDKKASKSDTTVTEYKLTFVPVEDFDPADYEDAE